MIPAAIPVLRIFDYEKCLAFYIKWLGFSIDREHRFNELGPVYLQVSLDEVHLHLTEHHGDCCPGGKVFIEYKGLKKLHTRLTGKRYKYANPELAYSPWGSLVMEVTDPFGNKLLFNEKLSAKAKTKA